MDDEGDGAAVMDTSLEADVVRILSGRGQTVATAESCTGGLVAHRLTNIPGSSACVLGGVVAYANEIKEQIAGVRHETLVQHGAVSAETAAELAQGIRRLFGVDVAVSVTGIAGPGGATAEKPVGLTYISVTAAGYELVRRYVWDSDRLTNKEQSADAALSMLLDYLRQNVQETMQASDDLLSQVDADIRPDGQVTPRAFTWRGQRLLVDSIGRQWLEGSRRHVLVISRSGETLELAVTMPAMSWTGRLISQRPKMV